MVYKSTDRWQKRTGRLGVPRLMPPAVRGQIGRAVEHLIALGAAVLDVNDSRAPVLRQPEGVVEQLPTQTAHVVTDPVLDLGLYFFFIFIVIMSINHPHLSRIITIILL